MGIIAHPLFTFRATMSARRRAAPATPTPDNDAAPPKQWTVEALSAATGVSVRNIRAYQTGGLLPPPRLQGRLGLYDDQHVAKLSLIRDLRQQGFKLDTIKGLLDQAPGGAWGEYALIGQLFSKTFFTVERPQRKALRDMAVHWGEGASEADRARLASNGLYRAVDADNVEMLSPALERIGIQLAEMRVPLNLVLDLQDTLVSHARVIAQAYVEKLFLQEVLRMAHEAEVAGAVDGTVDGGDAAGAAAGSPTSAEGTQADATGDLPASAATLRQLFERLRPLAIGSVSAAFPVVLQQEFEKALAKRR